MSADEPREQQFTAWLFRPPGSDEWFSVNEAGEVLAWNEPPAPLIEIYTYTYQSFAAPADADPEPTE